MKIMSIGTGVQKVNLRYLCILCALLLAVPLHSLCVTTSGTFAFFVRYY